MQYNAIIHGFRNVIFSGKICDITVFLIYASNIEFGYFLEPISNENKIISKYFTWL